MKNKMVFSFVIFVFISILLFIPSNAFAERIQIILEVQDTKTSSKTLNDIENIINKRLYNIGISNPLIKQENNRLIITISTIKPSIESGVELIDETIKEILSEKIEFNKDEISKLITVQGKLEFKEKEPETKKWINTDFSPEVFEEVKIKPSSYSNTWDIYIKLNQEDKKNFGVLTKRLLNKPLGIFLDNKLILAPVVKSEITGGLVVINGTFSYNQAKILAIQLKTGFSPTLLKLIEAKYLEP